MDELKELAQRVVNKLIDNNISLSAAESMTGGLFAKTVTDVPGASKIFDRSLVTYSKRAKFEELGVVLKEIAEYGVVSKQIADLMASGLNRKCGSQICISITGVAGPGPDEGVEAGTFFVGIFVNSRAVVRKFELGDIGREKVREKAVEEMLKLTEFYLDNELTTK